MRILQVSVGYPPSPGGVAQHVKNISERLAERHEVTVFTHNYRMMLPEEERINGVLIQRFRSFSPNAAYHLSLAMARKLRDSEFDVVHGHNYHALPLYFSRYAKRKRFVVTPHYHGHGHTPIRNFLLKLYKPFGRQIFTDADVVVSVSNYEKELLIKDFGIDGNKIRLIPNGIDGAEFAVKRGRKKAKTILYVGRLEQYKGVQYIIQMLPLLGDEYRLEIVGRGFYQGELTALVDRLGLSQRVKFNGLVPREELIKMYFQAAVLVLLSQREAFSMVVAEALAAKTPCVVANTSALKEWVDNRNCFGVDYPIDIAQLAEVIGKAVDRRVGDVKLWDWDEVVRELEYAYGVGEV